jgi:hypothetical protein
MCSANIIFKVMTSLLGLKKILLEKLLDGNTEWLAYIRTKRQA